MGCSSSRLEDEEAVQVCHKRKNFIRKAIAQRDLMASSHVAYAQSLRRASLALFYYLAEDEHLYLLQASPCKHLPCPSDKVLIINCFRPGWNPVFPLEQWPQEPAETMRVDTFFHSPPHETLMPATPQAPPWGLFWDPFSSLNDHLYDGIEEEGYPELEEEGGSDRQDHDEPPDGGGEKAVIDEGEGEGDVGAEGNAHAEEAEQEGEAEVVDVSNGLRMVGGAEVEQQIPGFTVHVHRRPASMAEAMKDVEGHFMKIIDTADEVSVLLEVIPCHNKVQSSAPRRADEQPSGSEASEEPFQLFRSHKASLDRLYEWEKKLYQEVKAGERVRIAYEKRCTQLRRQDADGAEPSAVDRTRAAIRELQTALSISFASVDSISKRIAALRDEELLPQLMQLIRGLARMWRVMADAHWMQKRTIDEAGGLLLSVPRPAAIAAPVSGNIRGPPLPPGHARAAAAAGALGAELRSWRAALAAWAESQRAYADALFGWAQSCVSDGTDMPRLLDRWARAVEAVNAATAVRVIDALAVEVAAIAAAARRRGSEEWDEEEGKKKVCAGLAVVFEAAAEVGCAAATAYEGLVAELEEGESEEAGREEISI